MIRILNAGPGTTIQDRGRFGYLRYGVVESGPMDWIAYELANRALENPPSAAALEIALGGIEIVCEERAERVAFAGGGFAWERDGKRLPSAAVVTLAPGERLRAASGTWGMWTYLAIEGGFDAPVVLGSRSTYARCDMGMVPRAGDALSAVPRLRVASQRYARDDTGVCAIASSLLARSERTIRVVLGPQDDYFTDEALGMLFGESFAVSPRFDRMGYWLDGPQLAHKNGFDIVSDGIPRGAMQVPGNGRVLVLMADHQSTGGYPKIGTVIRADFGLVAQRRPGEALRFALSGVDEARAALLAIYDELEKPVALEPVGAPVRSELLFASNLIGGIVDVSDDSARGS
ncbi:MAG: biotin-dependent carboxyltransferase family protein [Candidatus Eremiobacteraeota bacterium]|nr:biotin-dependent carboxyltransferase family protein [Candidatus Eremiobacteraeota bacterium]